MTSCRSATGRAADWALLEVPLLEVALLEVALLEVALLAVALLLALALLIVSPSVRAGPFVGPSICRVPAGRGQALAHCGTI
jgi:hypothetical protein